MDILFFYYFLFFNSSECEFESVEQEEGYCTGDERGKYRMVVITKK